MNLLKIVRNIQYQTAKIEVIELLFYREKSDDSSLTTKINYNLVSTLRQHLFDASEACFDATPETLPSCIATLQDTLSSAREFLAKINTDSISLQIQFPILKGLIADILTELNQLNTALNQIETQPQPQVLIQNSDNSISTSIPKINSNNLKKDVKTKPEDNPLEVLIDFCDGDDKKAETWIQFEKTRNSELSREEAIESAININKNLQDKNNIFLIIKKIISDQMEVNLDNEYFTNLNLEHDFWSLRHLLGADSLDIIEIGMDLETQFDIETSTEEIEMFMYGGSKYNFGKMIDCIHDRLHAPEEQK